jgi:hypothetical protein
MANARPCKNDCGRTTFANSGICALCQIGLDGLREVVDVDKKKQDISPKICKSCHNEFPPTGGNQRLCLDCKQKDLKKELKKVKKKTNSKPKAKWSTEIPAEIPLEPLVDHIVMLDFTEYPEVLNKISDQARANFRPVSMQIMYILHSDFEDISDLVKKLNEKEK